MTSHEHSPSIHPHAGAASFVAATLLAALALGLLAPLPAGAQSAGQMRQIGVLMGFDESDPQAQSRMAAFRQGLQTLGWAEGRNIRIDIRWATTSEDRK